MSSAWSHFDCNTSFPERRQHLRQPVRSLAYIELGEGNGGIVLNISEGGMAIQAVMSLKETDLPLMRVQLAHSKKQIQAKGRITWTTNLRKVAGIEFVDSSAETRALIREWISLESAAPGSPETIGPVAEEIASAASKLAKPAKATPEWETSPVQQDRTKPPASPIETRVSPPVVVSVRPRAPVVPAAAVPPAFVPAPAAPASNTAVRPLASPASGTTSKSAPLQTGRQTETGPRQIAPPAAHTIAAEPSIPVQLGPSVEPLAAPNPLRDPARLPPDRFGFKPIARPEAPLNLASQEPRENWRLSAWVGIFVIVSLAAGWVAGHGALHGVFQKVTRNSANDNVAAENAPGMVGNPLDISEMEVVDLNNERWMIPMQEPLGPLSSRRFESTASTHSQENRMNFRAWTLSPPVHSQNSTAETKSTPPILTSLSNGPRSVLPSDGTTGSSEGISVPPPPTANPLDSGLQPGELIRKVEPVYPPSAIDQRLEGTVKLFAVIGEDGNIKSLQPLSGPRELFSAALDAVRQWRYAPTLLNGRPIQTERQVTVVFRLAMAQ